MKRFGEPTDFSFFNLISRSASCAHVQGNLPLAALNVFLDQPRHFVFQFDLVLSDDHIAKWDC
jgi:hypothetical protein